MAQTVESMQNEVKISYGHNETQVIVQFSKPIDRLFMTPEQADDLIGRVEVMKTLLAEYRAKQAEPKVLDS